MFDNDNEIDCYHELISTEYSNLERNDFIFEKNDSRLNNTQIRSICLKYGVNPKKLQNDGLLIDYQDGTFRTMHIDLVFRAINAKAASWSPKIPLEFKLVKPKEEMMPSFLEHKLEELKPYLNLDEKSKNMLINALYKSGYDGFAHHQLHYLKELLTRKHKCYLLVSPTASGKSLIFYIAILVSVLSKPTVKGTKAIILYPRKALASDQLTKFLNVIYALNEQLSKEGLPVITVGIDDGDTPRSSASEEVKRSEVFRGIKCTERGCDGNLRYRLIRSLACVVCEKCNKQYKEIIATKGDIWSLQPSIVFSNLSALNRRLMTKQAQLMIGRDVEWIVLDEAHVYREEIGGHARWLLRRIFARFNTLLKGDVKFIISSATIHNPTGFVEKLLGLKEGIYYEEYSKVLAMSREKKKRLIINLIIAPNPLRSAESLVEELSLLLGVWGFAKGKKSIVFVDNVSEVERLRDFVVNTIINEREAQNDHIDITKTPSVADISESFSWRGLVGGLNHIDSTQLSMIYGYHYAELNPEERARVEEKFKNQASGVLFATSTMELGMDIGSIAAIIQYKVPLTSESYVQRIGRAGRSGEVGRVALGILVLTNSPSQIRYVLEDEYKRLLEPQVDIPVAWENEEIKKQHLIFSVLDYHAANNNNTFLDFTSEIRGMWFNVIDALNSLKAIIAEVRKTISGLYRYQEEITGDKSSLKILDYILDEVEKRADFGLKSYDAFSSIDVDDGLSKLRRAEDEVLRAKQVIEQALLLTQELKKLLSAKELDDYESSLKESNQSLSIILSALEKLWGG